MVRRLAKCIREYKLNTILTPLLVTGEIILEVLIPFIVARLVDEGIGKSDMKTVLIYGAVLLLAALVSLSFGAGAGRTCAVASAGFAKNLRHDMYYNVLRFSFSNIDKFSTSSIVTRLTTDVTNIQQSFMMLIRTAIRSPLMLIVSFAFVFRINAKLATIFIVVIPVLGIVAGFLFSRVHPIFKRVFKTYDKLNGVVEEDLRGIRVVKSYIREGYEIDKFNAISGSIYTDFSKAEKIMALIMPFMQLATYTAIILISWVGAKLIVESNQVEMTTGELMSMFTYSTQILMSFMMLSMLFVMIVMSRASGERIMEILDEEPDIKNPDEPVTEVKDGSVEYDGVNFAYYGNADELVLKDINLKIKSGMTVGVIGSTGSSKSTLVQLIPRLYDVKSGSVRVGGVDVRDYDMTALRDNVSMVLQKNVLFSGTIKDNLRWGNEDATDEELEHVCALAQADEFISKFPDGYDTYIEQGGANVSGGQKQRLCIARALLKKPKILILDDSTSAVDTATDAKIRAAFREYIPETTKIIIAQRVSSIEDSDMIVVMDEGRISGVGTHSELLENNEIYREVYESQVKGGGDDE